MIHIMQLLFHVFPNEFIIFFFCSKICNVGLQQVQNKYVTVWVLVDRFHIKNKYKRQLPYFAIFIHGVQTFKVSFDNITISKVVCNYQANYTNTIMQLLCHFLGICCSAEFINLLLW